MAILSHIKTLKPAPDALIEHERKGIGPHFDETHQFGSE
jgi:hypothetical protein